VSRPRLLSLAAIAVLCFSIPARPAHAESKDMIQLQTQIQDLQNAVAKLQQSNDERMGVMKDLVQQTADAVNKMSVAIDGMALKLQNQQDAAGTKSDQLSGQIQSLNDSIDELKARMARMEKSLSDIQGQQQTMSGILNNLPQSTGTPSSPAPAMQPSTPPPANDPNQGDALPPTASVIAPIAQAAPAAAPVGDLYRTAYGDYIGAKYPLAASEFQALATAYPDDNLSGNAYFYMGEIDLRTQKPTAAIKMYNHLIEHFPDNVKVPAAHLHKAEAMIAMKQDDGAARELRALIQRFPNSPEASTARNRLVSLSARR